VGGLLFEALPWRAVPVVSGILMAIPGIVWLMALARRNLVVHPTALNAPPVAAAES